MSPIWNFIRSPSDPNPCSLPPNENATLHADNFYRTEPFFNPL